jgi:hypothetical protein
MDKLKELSDKLKGRIKIQQQFDANFKHPSPRHLVVKNYRGYKIRFDDHVDLITVGVKVNSELAFSVNRPNILFSYKMPMELAHSPCILYVRDETNYLFKEDPTIKKFLTSFFSLLTQLHLSSTESAFFYRNYILFAFDMQRELIAVTDDIVDFIIDNKNIFGKESQLAIFSSEIPENLKPLLPYVKKYAISDDAEREQLKEDMNESEKSRLIMVVKPLFYDINAFLNSFKDKPLSEEAVSIGELAELVSELLISDE